MEIFLQQHDFNILYIFILDNIRFKRFVQHPLFSSKQMGEAIEIREFSAKNRSVETRSKSSH